ncbi:MAG: DUF4147 domain-containing protein, partial [Thermoplasmata archaeon]
MTFKIENESDIFITERRSFILNVLKETFDDLDPGSLVKSHLKGLDLSMYEKIYIIGFGKASMAMYSGLREMALSKLAYAGIIVPTGETVSQYPELHILTGTHPYTSDLSVNSSMDLLSHVRPGKDDLVIVLVSGGGSSLFEIPEDGIEISFIADTSKKMMDSGSDIYELNAIRSVLSKVKGGKLARILYPAKVQSFIVSDVPGDDISVIASGPLVRLKNDPRLVYEKYKKVLDPKIENYLDQAIINDVYFKNV